MNKPNEPIATPEARCAMPDTHDDGLAELDEMQSWLDICYEQDLHSYGSEIANENAPAREEHFERNKHLPNVSQLAVWPEETAA